MRTITIAVASTLLVIGFAVGANAMGGSLGYTYQPSIYHGDYTVHGVGPNMAPPVPTRKHRFDFNTGGYILEGDPRY